jgi:hypothetical protein
MFRSRPRATAYRQPYPSREDPDLRSRPEGQSLRAALSFHRSTRLLLPSHVPAPASIAILRGRARLLPHSHAPAPASVPILRGTIRLLPHSRGPDATRMALLPERTSIWPG